MLLPLMSMPAPAESAAPTSIQLPDEYTQGQVDDAPLSPSETKGKLQGKLQRRATQDELIEVGGVAENRGSPALSGRRGTRRRTSSKVCGRNYKR